MGKPVTEELGNLVISAVAGLDEVLKQTPRLGVSMVLPDMPQIVLATTEATNSLPNNVDQGRGLA